MKFYILLGETHNLQLSKPKVNLKKMVIIIVILTISAYLLLVAYLPMLALSQLPFLPDNSHTNAKSNHRSTHSTNNNDDNNKISSSEGANSSSLNKVGKTTKPTSLTSQTNTIKVTENISYKGVDKFGIKEIYPTARLF
jgi:cytoskeletal protein RodZ